ncbi:MAG: molybdopterin-dependent oxidoreductase [Actinomycetota bacterium]
MAGRRTNLALSAALATALISGGLAFGVGSSWSRLVVAAHGALGLTVLLLSPWKSVIARRGLRRARPGRASSMTLSLMVVVVVLTGISHATGVAVSLGPVSAMQVHVGVALAAMPLALWHVVRRPQRVHRADLSRRNALRAGALVGAGGIAYLGIEGASRALSLPGAKRRTTGSYEAGSSRPEEMPVTQWLFDDVPAIEPVAWSLRVRDRTFGYEELAAYEDTVRATLDCTGGWYAHQEWSGVRLDRLLDGGGRSIAVTSATGYRRLLPTSAAADLLLALRVGGRPLSAGHGFPARIVAPGRRGFWWVKWVASIEPSDIPWWLQPPFPLQ